MFSVYFELQMIFHLCKIVANYFTNQSKENPINCQVLFQIEKVCFPYDR